MFLCLFCFFLKQQRHLNVVVCIALPQEGIIGKQAMILCEAGLSYLECRGGGVRVLSSSSRAS